MVKLTEDMVVARSKGSELHNIKKLNCWGSELTDVAVVRKLPNVEVLSLSVNQISTLEDFQHCSNLQELYIRKNNIGDINEVLYLRQLPKLKSLWLSDNPCADFKEYRLTVLRALPHLQKLDNVFVEPEEVQKALVCGLTLPLPNSSFRGVDPSGITCSSSIGDSLKSESGSDISPTNPQQVPQGNNYNQSLEEGYEYTQNLYDEDEEQPPLRHTNYVSSKQDESYERRMPQQNYPAQERSRCLEGYRHSFADYEDDRSSVGSTHQSGTPNRRQSYAGCPSNRQQHRRQSPPRRSSQSAPHCDQDLPTELPRSYSRASAEYVHDARNANYLNKDDFHTRYTDFAPNPCTITNSPISPLDANETNKNCRNSAHRKLPRDSYREQSWASDIDCFPRGDTPSNRADLNYHRNDTYGSHYIEGRSNDYRSPSNEVRHYSSRGHPVGEVLQQHYDNTYRRIDQQIESAAARGTNLERPSPTRPYPIRPKTRNANVLSAVLCLIKELDYSSLEVVEMAIRCRMEEMDD